MVKHESVTVIPILVMYNQQPFFFIPRIKQKFQFAMKKNLMIEKSKLKHNQPPTNSCIYKIDLYQKKIDNRY